MKSPKYLNLSRNLKFRNSLCLFFLFILSAGLSGLSAQNFPALEADPRAAGYGRQGTYYWEDYGEIGLWASVTGEAAASGSTDANLRRIKDAAAELLASADLPSGEKDRGEYVLRWMHRKFLKNYSALQTRIDTLLSRGSYNCVSSAVLYLTFASAAGLETRGVLTKDHAFARVRVENEWIDVETTNPYGFDPGNRKEFHDQFGKSTGFAYVPARNYRDRAEISPLELLSLIIHNRIADLESKNRYTEAIPLAISRANLLRERRNAVSSPIFADPDKDMMDRIFNYGAYLMMQGKEDTALAWAKTAEPVFPDQARWQEFTDAATNNLIVKLCRSGKFAEAHRAFEENRDRIGAEKQKDIMGMIYDAELSDRSRKIRQASEEPELLSAIDSAEKGGFLQPERAGELRTFVIGKTAGFLSSKRDWLAGIDYLEKALRSYGPNRELEANLAIFRGNRVSDIHNTFAGAFNKGQFDEAARILEAALAEFPDNRQLLQDKHIMEQTVKTNP
jgi:tetratricopeptide (TPR) repeat protein